MITTVTLNPAIDRSIFVEELVTGSLNRVQSVTETIGGKGINVTKVLCSLGADSRAMGLIGEQNYDQVYTLLAQEHFKSKWVRVDGVTRINTKIFDRHTRKTTELNEAGFLVDHAKLHELKELIMKHAKMSEYVVFGGSLPKGASQDLYYNLINSVRNDTRTILDAEGESLKEGLKAKPHIISPNLFELESVLGFALDSQEKMIDGAKMLINSYQIETVLLSLGADGCLLATADNVYISRPLEIDVKRTVGAGDSLLAGYLYGLSSGESEPEALKWAVACAALTVTSLSGDVFKKAEVDALRQQVILEHIEI